MRALASLWRDADLPDDALADIDLPGDEPLVASSFAIGTAAQASLAAAALAAAEIWHRRDPRGRRQRVSVAMRDAVLESSAHFRLDGVAPTLWDKLSGLYPCADGRQWVRIHANFAHHRDGALRLLGLPAGPQVERTDVVAALRAWSAQDVEDEAAARGLVVAAARDFATWDAHAQAVASTAMAPVAIERIAAAPHADPLPWPGASGEAPLRGVRVLDLTRILAGPVAGRTLAAYGAEVMLVNSPSLPNIEAIADTSRGKLSVHVDLARDEGRATLRELSRSARVFLQAYRPGALDALGFSPLAVASLRPGIVYVSLSAYGPVGPWAARRGFDSLVQTATGFNLAEAAAFGAAEPKPMPLQILDYAAGYLLAFGAQAALLRQAQEGGSWHVQVSLAGVGRWLRALGRVHGGTTAVRPTFEGALEESDSGFGRLVAVRHAARFSITPARYARPSMPPGTHVPAWPKRFHAISNNRSVPP